jgi:hypothetical protein
MHFCLCIVGLGFSSGALENSFVSLNGLRLYLHFEGHFGYVALVIVTHDLAFIVVVKKYKPLRCIVFCLLRSSGNSSEYLPIK